MTWVSRIVRLGYLAKGLIYTLIGVLALRVAFGMRGGRLSEPAGVCCRYCGSHSAASFSP